MKISEKVMIVASIMEHFKGLENYANHDRVSKYLMRRASQKFVNDLHALLEEKSKREEGDHE